MKSIASLFLVLFVCTLRAVDICAEDEAAEKRPENVLERILEDDDKLLPEKVVRIDFDTDADGTPTESGRDISKSYVTQGCTFATSFADSFVAIQPYNVGGRSGGKSAATHEPLYQGIITVQPLQKSTTK